MGNHKDAIVRPLNMWYTIIVIRWVHLMHLKPPAKGGIRYA